jgi:hypothetical protein
MASTDQLTREMVSRLRDAVGDRLRSVLLYGPLAHGDGYPPVGHANLMLVLSDLEPGTLRDLRAPVRWWLRKDQPWPRLFTPELIVESRDIYPIELIDLARHHRVLHGDDPLADLAIDRDKLRLQCERELRENLMRLREGYVECGDRAVEVGRLLTIGYAAFARVFRGCLHLYGVEVPVHDREVVTALCAVLDLGRAGFDAAEEIAHGRTRDGDGPSVNPDVAFAAFYQALTAVVARVDRLLIQAKGSTP